MKPEPPAFTTPADWTIRQSSAALGDAARTKAQTQTKSRTKLMSLYLQWLAGQGFRLSDEKSGAGALNGFARKMVDGTRPRRFELRNCS
jgi:hypothetical protein